MATTTGNPLEEAYKLILAAETQLVKDLDTAVTEFLAKLDELAKPFPTTGGSAAVAGLQRIRNSVSGNTSYELQSLKTTFGLNPVTAMPPAMPIPA